MLIAFQHPSVPTANLVPTSSTIQCISSSSFLGPYSIQLNPASHYWLGCKLSPWHLALSSCWFCTVIEFLQAHPPIWFVRIILEVRSRKTREVFSEREFFSLFETIEAWECHLWSVHGSDTRGMVPLRVLSPGSLRDLRSTRHAWRHSLLCRLQIKHQHVGVQVSQSVSLFPRGKAWIFTWWLNRNFIHLDENQQMPILRYPVYKSSWGLVCIFCKL